ncbi:YveK family protein [Guptibacillus hwajinpoensis]|uniref:Capsular polysaccharide biosynthesis protein n=1 Tax=Guptibacillus hwajinpoensis TaxID=208199 RepID=A0ABU0JZB3_9BACL|nr:Wzz/FepE/Etk N-terminal domain-containing protein [Alkalihalobacillus hemicentroti]MDQ0482428.1 capsular polysaccharide biosynthesis protein [Alkalihalobacillus hemicentroti]
MEETISLKEIFSVLKKRLTLILLITLLATATSGVVSYFLLTPIYQTSTQILVNQKADKENAFDYNQVKTNVELINTYSVIIKSPTILDQVVDDLNLDLSTGALNEKISVSNAQNSQVVSIDVKDPDPTQAVKIANTTASVFEKEISSIMNVDNVSVLSKANFEGTPSPVNPNPVLNMAIALVVGLMVGVGLAFLLEYLDNTIKDEDDIEKLLGLPVLGTIAVIEDKEVGSSKSQSKKSVRGETVES